MSGGQARYIFAVSSFIQHVVKQKLLKSVDFHTRGVCKLAVLVQCIDIDNSASRVSQSSNDCLFSG